ncbi:MAG: ROK family protein [Lentisphaerae bacterium]|nr:ROK family protein [Lentisphaerota bacterium]
MKNNELKDILLQKLLMHRRLTRQDFLSMYPCRPASMLSAINELKSCGYISEPDRTTAKTGRRSPALTMNPNFGAFAGIELQAHKMLGILIDNDENILAEAVLDFPAGITAAAVPGKLAEIIGALRNRQSSQAPPWRGIGFADPGLVDLEQQKSLRAHNVPGWVDVPVCNYLQELTRLNEIFIAPETMARTFAEYYAHRPLPPGSLCLVELDTGIGGSFIKDGLLLSGSSSRGMEIGHLVIKPNGPLCKCGNQGCLEAIAGEYGIQQKTAEMIAGRVTTILRANGTLDDFVEAVKKHDRAAALLASEVCEAVASAVTILVTLLNPNAIVFSGRLAKLDDILLDTVKRTLSVNCFYGAIEKLQLKISRQNEFAAARGAALLIRNRILRPGERMWL